MDTLPGDNCCSANSKSSNKSFRPCTLSAVSLTYDKISCTWTSKSPINCIFDVSSMSSMK